jgi:hypothetical protein
MGAPLGAVIGALSYQKPKGKIWALDFGPGGVAIAGGISGAFVGFITGGVMGAANSADEIYRLSERNRYTKIMIIRDVMVEEK